MNAREMMTMKASFRFPIKKGIKKDEKGEKVPGIIVRINSVKIINCKTG